MIVTPVTYYKTSDGKVHNTRQAAEAHERSLIKRHDSALYDEMRRRWPDLATEKQSYQDGLARGLNWRWSHTPGGPWVCTEGVRLTPDPVWSLYCEQTYINNRAWLRGWRDGFNQKNDVKTPAEILSA